MSKKHPPKPNTSVSRALKEVRKNFTPRSNGRKTVAERIVDEAGDELHLIVEMMCDATVTSSFIHRVVGVMGIKVSYIHFITNVRPWFIENYGYYNEIVNGEKYPAPAQQPPHHISVDLV